jgi:hypothetical protein
MSPMLEASHKKTATPWRARTYVVVFFFRGGVDSSVGRWLPRHHSLSCPRTDALSSPTGTHSPWSAPARLLDHIPLPPAHQQPFGDTTDSEADSVDDSGACESRLELACAVKRRFADPLPVCSPLSHKCCVLLALWRSQRRGARRYAGNVPTELQNDIAPHGIVTVLSLCGGRVAAPLRAAASPSATSATTAAAATAALAPLDDALQRRGLALFALELVMQRLALDDSHACTSASTHTTEQAHHVASNRRRHGKAALSRHTFSCHAWAAAVLSAICCCCWWLLASWSVAVVALMASFSATRCKFWSIATRRGRQHCVTRTGTRTDVCAPIHINRECAWRRHFYAGVHSDACVFLGGVRAADGQWSGRSNGALARAP